MWQMLVEMRSEARFHSYDAHLGGLQSHFGNSSSACGSGRDTLSAFE